MTSGASDEGSAVGTTRGYGGESVAWGRGDAAWWFYAAPSWVCEFWMMTVAVVGDDVVAVVFFVISAILHILPTKEIQIMYNLIIVHNLFFKNQSICNS